MIGKLLGKENDLYFKKNDGHILYVNNVFKYPDGFHQVSGWYIDPTPLSLDETYEVNVEDNGISCKIIKQIENESRIY